MAEPKFKLPKSPIVVHLGNVGLNFSREIPAFRTLKFSSRFNKFHFFGIDLRALERGKKVCTFNNWTQVQSDLISGLHKLENSSVSLISSEMTLGYYGRKRIKANKIELKSRSMRYAFEVMKLAMQKLKSKGKLIVIIDEILAKEIIEAGIKAGFSKDLIREEVLNLKNFENHSYWTIEYSLPDNISKELKMIAVTFQKK